MIQNYPQNHKSGKDTDSHVHIYTVFLGGKNSEQSSDLWQAKLRLSHDIAPRYRGVIRIVCIALCDKGSVLRAYTYNTVRYKSAFNIDSKCYNIILRK